MSRKLYRLIAGALHEYKWGVGPPPRPGPRSFEELQASVLFCGRCRAPRPVRERLLLVLPDGELNEYLCRACGASVGTRKVTGAAPVLVGR
jgi:hypothetical protein